MSLTCTGVDSPPVELPAAILTRIDFGGDCWEWTGGRLPNGYGRLTERGRTLYAHRLVWEALVALIPPHLELDHLCRNRACVNPDHLEPVSPGQNTSRSPIPKAGRKRKSHCKWGHPIHISPSGQRFCLECARNRRRRRSAAREAA